MTYKKDKVLTKTYNSDIHLPEHFLVGHSATDLLLFADGQAVISIAESKLQVTVHSCKKFGLYISISKTKVIHHIRPSSKFTMAKGFIDDIVL